MKAFRNALIAVVVGLALSMGSAFAASTVLVPPSGTSPGNIQLNDSVGTVVSPATNGTYTFTTTSNSMIANTNCTGSGFGKYGLDTYVASCCSGAGTGTCVNPLTAEAAQTTARTLLGLGWTSAAKGGAIPGTFAVTTAGTAVAPGVTQAQTAVTVTGLATTSVCVCAPATLPATWQTGIAVACVPTANTATCEEINGTAGTITPAAVSLNVVAFY